MISRWITTKACVVKEHEDYEGGVEDGEGDQQVVERVRHLLQKNLIKVPIIISKILFQIQYNPGIMHKRCYVHLVVRINLKNRTWPERTATERRLPMSPTTPTLGIRTPCLYNCKCRNSKEKNHDTISPPNLSWEHKTSEVPVSVYLQRT